MSGYIAGTEEFLAAAVTSNVPLEDQGVALRLTSLDWTDADWVGPTEVSFDEGRTWRTGVTLPPSGGRVRFKRQARTLDPVVLPDGTFDVLVKVNDDPEVPVLFAGRIDVRTVP